MANRFGEFIRPHHFTRRALVKNGVYLVGLQAISPCLMWADFGEASDASNERSCPSDFQSSYPPPLRRFIDKLDPRGDVFITEVYAEQIEALLTQWTQAMRSKGLLLEDFLTMDFSGTLFDSSVSIALTSSTPITVERRIFQSSRAANRGEFLADWQRYLAPFSTLDVADSELFSIQLVEGILPLVIKTEVAFRLCGQNLEHMREQRSGIWTMHWQHGESDKWKIKSWTAKEETRSLLRGAAFSDVTSQYLVSSAAMEQLDRGIDDWRGILDAASGIDIYGNHGVAVGDIDNSSFDSIYVCQPSGLPNRLFHNRADGTFEDITDLSGTGLLDGTASAIFADFSNSGRQDLLVVRSGGPMLFRNLGKGRFEAQPEAFKFARPPQGTFTSVTVADYNRDGMLDVYFCVYSYYQGLSRYQFPSPYYDAQNGPPNFLFRNRGDGTFEDVTVASGMDVNNNRFSFAAEWCDFDNDGWPDLHVANDFGRKNLYRNNRDGTFQDVAAEMGVEDYGPGMSTCWFDFNNDGRQDLYVANMWLPQGKRITANDQFLPGVDQKTRALYQKHNAGNSLFENDGSKFKDRSSVGGTSNGGWSWSSSAWDFDHDGFTDLYVTNGFISGAKKKDLQSFFWRQVAQRSAAPVRDSTDYEMSWNAVNELVRSDYSWSGYQRNAFFLNHRDGSFTDIANVLGLDLIDDSRAFALSDFDHDGRLEFALKNRTGPQLRIMQNDLDGIGESLFVKLNGTKSNRDAVGATVTVIASGLRQTKVVSAGSGFASQHTKELCFGLGKGGQALELLVKWPSGLTSRFGHISPNQRVEIVEGSQQIKTIAYRRRSENQAKPQMAPTPAPAVTSTMLTAPLFGPDLYLSDQNMNAHRLGALTGKPLLLTFLGARCDSVRSQLADLQSAKPSFDSAGLGAYVVLVVDSLKKGSAAAGRTALIAEAGSTFPLLLADERQVAPWNIQFRYLFDRRREMVYPTSFLLNKDGAVERVYQGPVEASRVLQDSSHLELNDSDRLSRALPYKGPYYGNLMSRDYFSYGIAFVEYGFLDEAQAAFERVLAANPQYPGAAFNLGTVLFMKKDYPAAERALRAAVLVNPTDSDAWNNLGMIAAQESNYDDALHSFRESAFANPNHLAAVENMMKIYRFQSRSVDARKTLEALLAKAPESPDLHLGLAMTLVAQHELEAGRRELEQAIQLRPNYPDAINNLGSVLLLSGDQQGALAHFNKCRELAPDFNRAAINAALVEARLGHQATARDILTEFLNRHHDDAEVQAALLRLGKA